MNRPYDRKPCYHLPNRRIPKESPTSENGPPPGPHGKPMTDLAHVTPIAPNSDHPQPIHNTPSSSLILLIDMQRRS